MTMATFDSYQIAISALVFLLAAGTILGGGFLMSARDHRVNDRLREFCKTDRESSLQLRGMMRLLVPNIPALAEVLMPNDEASRTRLQTQLVKAGIYAPWALKTYFTVKLVAMVVPPLVVFLVYYAGLLSGPIALMCGGISGVLGMFLPGTWLHRMRVRRQMVLRKSLPDFLDLIVACLEGGISMQAALKQVADELRMAHPIFAAELQVVQREMELGLSLEQSLSRLAERTGVEELRSLAAFVHQAARFGTTMAEAMRQLSDMLRSQRELRAEELAQQAAVKILFPTLLFIFPTVFVVLAGPAAIKIREGLTGSGENSSSPLARK
jgi:tight adherence protein C